jgi:hypothetical protein
MRRLVAALLLAPLLAGCGSADGAGPGVGPGPGTATASGAVWTAVGTGSLSARHEAVAAWAGDRFLVFGGWSSRPCPPGAACGPAEQPPLRDGASLDPVSGRWERIADAPVPIAGTGAVVVGGRVYVLTPDQGRDDAPVAFLAYDPNRDAWTRLPEPGSGGALVAAGASLIVVPSSDEQHPAVDRAFDPGVGRWRELPDDPLGPSFDREAVWTGDRLLLDATDLVPNPGSEGPALVRLATLDLDSRRWSALPDSDIIGGGAVAVAGRVVWPDTGSADGGETNPWPRAYDQGGILDPSTGAWRSLPDAAPNSAPGRCCAVPVGRRLFMGDGLLDPVTGTWSRLPSLPGGPRDSVAVAAGPDTVLIWGGVRQDDPVTNLATGVLLRVAPGG